MKKKKETGWVKCTRQLPPEGVVVLAKDDGDYKSKLIMRNHIWYTVFMDFSECEIYYTPVAWKLIDENNI